MSIEDLVFVKRSPRAKRVALRVDSAERVVNLVIPQRMPLHKAYVFASQHEAWIKEQLAKMPQVIDLTHGARIPLFGEDVVISIDHSDLYRRTTIKRTDYTLDITTPLPDPRDKIVTFLKKYAREGLADMANEKVERIGKTISSITVRDTKTRWGSCAQDGSLSFSWRLLFAPYIAADYVVAHEIAHLVHMNHGKEFWKLCSDLSENYKDGHRWMKKNGNELMRYR